MAFESFIHLLRGIQGRKGSGGIGNIQDSRQLAFTRFMQKEIDKNHELNIPLQELNVVVFDIETTGFSPEKGDSILSIGAIKMCGTKIQEKEEFYSLIYQKDEIPEGIVKLTGITNEKVGEASPLEEVLLKFFQYTQGSILVAHHANHERKFMNHVSQQLFRTHFKPRIVDTQFLYKITEPKMNLINLEDLCEHNGIVVENRHHALGDAKLTAKLWSIYLEKVQQLGCETLDDVYHRFSGM